MISKRKKRTQTTSNDQQILAGSIEEFFMYSDRSQERTILVKKLLNLLSKSPNKWTPRTIRLWFNNNKTRYMPKNRASNQNSNFHEIESSYIVYPSPPPPRTSSPTVNNLTVQPTPVTGINNPNIQIPSPVPQPNIAQQPQPQPQGPLMPSNQCNLQMQYNANFQQFQPIQQIGGIGQLQSQIGIVPSTYQVFDLRYPGDSSAQICQIMQPIVPQPSQIIVPSAQSFSPAGNPNIVPAVQYIQPIPIPANLYAI